ncbi:MAG: VOC family protein [Actinomycetota bacterium]|nr:VOC family protein [Actinomycetota bacterium]
MLEPTLMYHVCWVVPQLESGMTGLANLGLRWASPVTRTVHVGYRDGRELEHSINVTYSCDGPMYVELVEHATGSVWETSPMGGLHHVGFWSDDLRASITLAESQGHTLEAWMIGADGRPSRFAYLRTPTGHRFEYVDAKVRPDLEAWMRGGQYRIRDE